MLWTIVNQCKCNPALMDYIVQFCYFQIDLYVVITCIFCDICRMVLIAYFITPLLHLLFEIILLKWFLVFDIVKCWWKSLVQILIQIPLLQNVKELLSNVSSNYIHLYITHIIKLLNRNLEYMSFIIMKFLFYILYLLILRILLLMRPI